ncbi:MAG: cysteine--tRNA ligase [Candidatus Syntrophonatronum acetioxidans]|uniref:Cysteine--tRNA ligase n=1 Tax=Candidatus Syntrophonatronum acetioxidans TaxID=1795816 RepID=A0A424Y978_9FIRM|nr:MAG: cysteine--tRNA ligase [Candidatus Syntrophonatronum acetioxidans]
MKLYNTLTRRIEEFVPLRGNEVGFYVCGPTVYDYFHIGNARVFIVFDVIRRYLEYRGYEVNYVQNFTDIEDKMIKRAQEMGITMEELAEKYIEAYLEDADALGIRRADVHPRATEHIPEIIEIIQKLMEKDLAYEVEGDVYFDTGNFPEYGRLSYQDMEELESGSRVEVDERKKSPMDFALWKKAKEGEPSWDSPWGPGRPGWHIECSAMSMKYLGETLDIHAGGPDLTFPHHENEIAQSEGATGKQFVRYWMHVGYLNIDKQKMSKSLGNILTVREIRKNVDPQVVRFFMLSAHYRSPINFSFELLDQAKGGLERLNTLIYTLLDLKEKAQEKPEEDRDKEMREAVTKYRQKFEESMDDDFNTADALAALFELARETNIYVKEGKNNLKVIEEILDTYREVGDILGLFANLEKEELDVEIEELIQKRQEARKVKDFATADSIRDQLLERGIILEDTPQGVRWKRKS